MFLYSGFSKYSFSKSSMFISFESKSRLRSIFDIKDGGSFQLNSDKNHIS
jgi:hypothetical protein